MSLHSVKHPGSAPTVVVICGSTRFHREMHRVTLWETLQGRIVLVVGTDDKSDDELGITPEQKECLEALHRHKIDMAAEVLIVNPGGYIGESTAKEIDYATSHHKVVRYTENVDSTKTSKVEDDGWGMGFTPMTPCDKPTSREDAVCSERREVYGSPQEMQQRVATMWTQILRANSQREDVVIEPKMVGLMMAVLKIYRAANPLPKKDADSYVDCYNYLRFAEEADESINK